MNGIGSVDVNLYDSTNNSTFVGTLEIFAPDEDAPVEAANDTAWHADPSGASTYIVIVLCVYGLSIVFLIASHTFIKKKEENFDKQMQSAKKYFQEAPDLREKDARETYKKLKHSVIPVVAQSGARDLVSRRKSFMPILAEAGFRFSADGSSMLRRVSSESSDGGVPHTAGEWAVQSTSASAPARPALHCITENDERFSRSRTGFKHWPLPAITTENETKNHLLCVPQFDRSMSRSSESIATVHTECESSPDISDARFSESRRHYSLGARPKRALSPPSPRPTTKRVTFTDGAPPTVMTRSALKKPPASVATRPTAVSCHGPVSYGSLEPKTGLITQSDSSANYLQGHMSGDRGRATAAQGQAAQGQTVQGQAAAAAIQAAVSVHRSLEPDPNEFAGFPSDDELHVVKCADASSTSTDSTTDDVFYDVTSAYEYSQLLGPNE